MSSLDVGSAPAPMRTVVRRFCRCTPVHARLDCISTRSVLNRQEPIGTAGQLAPARSNEIAKIEPDLRDSGLSTGACAGWRASINEQHKLSAAHPARRGDRVSHLVVKIADPLLMREINKYHVLETIRCFGRISRVEISERTLLSGTTVSAITAALIDEGLIEAIHTGPVPEGQRGRPRVLLDLIAEGGLCRRHPHLGGAHHHDHRQFQGRNGRLHAIADPPGAPDG